MLVIYKVWVPSQFKTIGYYLHEKTAEAVSGKYNQLRQRFSSSTHPGVCEVEALPVQED
jgi:hypothetical protein